MFDCTKDKYNVYDLVEIVKILRGQGGCPWDIEQTHKSLRRGMLEEAYEACEAIDLESADMLKEELGDVLAQVVFHADIERQAGGFDIDDVADGICKKFIFRHPHIFAGEKADTADQVLQNWDKLKQKEKGHKTVYDTMNSVSKSLPALWRAEKLLHKAEKNGFALCNLDKICDFLKKEVDKLQKVCNNNCNGQDIGNILLYLVQLAMISGVDPEVALGQACDNFVEQFRE